MKGKPKSAAKKKAAETPATKAGKVAKMRALREAMYSKKAGKAKKKK